MRLTLRTLLAYLDDILEPSQTKEIGDKLNESSFASSLVSRIREVMRRRRLTAPTLSGPGVGIDPNTVAEYLDNTLPPDGVADVEKICLESDVHLAEAAACHQILTLALGEPVEIAAQTRERMYALGPSAAKMAISQSTGINGRNGDGSLHDGLDDVLAQAPVATAPAARHAASRAEPAKPVVPDYLRQRSTWPRILVYASLVLVAIVWVTIVLRQNPFAGRSAKTDDGSADQIAQAQAQEQEGAGAGSAEPLEMVADSELRGNQVPSTAGSVQQPVEEAAVAAATASVEGNVVGESAEEPAPASVRRQPRRRPARPAPEGASADESEPPEADEPPAVMPAPPSKYVSKEGVTLNYLRRDERWYVLRPHALVHAGDLLDVPEPFQCTLEIDGGKGFLTILGRSAVQILDATEAGAFGIELRRGQFIVRPAGAGDDESDPLKIAVGIAGELWKLEVRPGAACGLEISLFEPRQFEQAMDKSSYLGAFYVDNGLAVVTDPAGHAFEIKGPGWLQLPLKIEGNTIPAQQRLLALPKWMGPQLPSSIQQGYARKFESKFTPDEAVELTVPDQAADANPAISRLATECLALIEAYGPLVDVLQRSPNPEVRLAAISGLRVWLPRNPDNRDLLKAELAKHFPPDESEIVYRLLWGFNTDDARDPKVSEELVELMGHPERTIRELAFYHVQFLTGKNHGEYRPDGSPTKRKTALDVWKRYLRKEGALLPAQKPVPNPQ